MPPEKSAGALALEAHGQAQTFAVQHLNDTKAGLEKAISDLTMIVDNTFYHDGVRSRAEMIREYLRKELTIFGTQGGS